jgi:hypothetical protein
VLSVVIESRNQRHCSINLDEAKGDAAFITKALAILRVRRA